MLQKWRHKNGSTVFMITSAKPKRSILRSEKDGDWTAAEHNPQRRTWISEQSPIRCRGASSSHSVESVSNQKKPKVIHTNNLLEFGKYCEEVPWKHRTTTLYQSDVEQKKRHQPYNCNLNRMISGWILWSAITICEMSRTSWQTGNLKMKDMLCSRGEFGKKMFWLLRLKNWKS